MLSGSQLCPTPFPLKSSSHFSDISKELCKSSVSSNSPSENALQAQIAQLKEKAHQSFMQVIQIQQLHDQELDLLREEHSQRECELQHKINELEERLSKSEELELRVQQLEYENSAMERNYKMHFCQMDDDLSIDNIEIITPQQESVDESSIAYFQEVLNLYQREEEFQTDKVKLVNQMRVILASSYGSGNTISTIEQNPLFLLTTKILGYVSCVRLEWIRLLERERQRERDNQPAKEAQDHKGYESLQRESKFMADHIKRLSGEKLRAEKQAAELERQLRTLSEKMKKIENSLLKKGIQLDEFSKRKSPCLTNENDISLELNEFISENFKNSSNINSHSHLNNKPHHGLIRSYKH